MSVSATPPIAEPPPASLARPNDCLPNREVAAYASGIIAYQFPNNSVSQLALPLFNVVFGVSPALIGTALMIGRIWDACTNPIVGLLSDNTRSRWGRRRPWLAVGAMLTALAFPILWFVPRGWEPQAIVFWLLGGLFLLYTAFALFSVPYIALGFELTPNYEERTRIYVWRNYFQLVPSLAGGWALWFCNRPWFKDPLEGVHWFGIIVGALILLTGLPVALFTRERYYRLSAEVKSERFWPALRSTWANKPFRIIIAIIVTILVGGQSTDALSYYVLVYHVLGGDTVRAATMVGVVAGLSVAVALVALPVVQYIAKRWDKNGALRFCLWVNIAAAGSKWWLATPAHPWLWYILMPFTQFGSIGFWTIVASMKSDACDWDELASGRRREGVYGAVNNVVTKVAMSLPFFLAGFALHAIGFEAARGGAQDASTIHTLRLLFSLGPIFFFLLSLWFLRHYPLNASAMQDLRATLERRRSAV